jgi:hypothetical protein
MVWSGIHVSQHVSLGPWERLDQTADSLSRGEDKKALFDHWLIVQALSIRRHDLHYCTYNFAMSLTREFARCYSVQVQSKLSQKTGTVITLDQYVLSVPCCPSIHSRGVSFVQSQLLDIKESVKCIQGGSLQPVHHHNMP